MNFADAAYYVTVAAGAGVGAFAFCKGAQACLRAHKKEQARKRQVAEIIASIPEPTPFIAPDNKYRL